MSVISGRRMIPIIRLVSALMPSVRILYAVSVAPVWQFAPRFKLALDVGVNTNPNEPDPSLTTYAMLALIYSPTKDVDLGIAYQRNATNFGTMFSANEANTSRFQAGVTYRFD